MIVFRNQHLTRQADLIPESALGERITIIGAGAIGSWVTLALAKMGFQNLTVFDHDTLEIENMNSQFYPRKSVGLKKAHALAHLVDDFTGVKITAHPDKWETGKLPGTVIACVDSMAVRTALWDEHSGKSLATRAIIDPRMGAENALLYVMKPMDIRDDESYRKSLYTDKDAVQEACTSKATIYCALSLSGLVVTQVKALVTGKPYGRVIQWAVASNTLLSTQSI